MKTTVEEPSEAVEDFVTRGQRSMIKAAEKARKDYERFGLEPVIVPFRKKLPTEEEVIHPIRSDAVNAK